MIRFIMMMAALTCWPAVARADWHEVSSPHFVIYADDKPERIHSFAEALERFDQAVRVLRRLPNTPVNPASRVTIYVAGSDARIAKFAGSQGIAGFYAGRASGSVAFIPKLETGDSLMTGQLVLFHEYSHHLMMTHYAQAAFPLWLTEGWAEFHATAKVSPRGDVSFGHAANHRSYGILRDKIALEQVLKGFDGINPLNMDSFYGRSWLLTHYLSVDAGRIVQFARYIDEINKGTPALQAAKVFGDLKAMDRELNRYSRKSLLIRTVPAERITIGRITSRSLTPGEAALMTVRMESHSGVTQKTAPRVYAAAKKAAAPYPDEPAVQIVLAETAFDAGLYSETLAACERALTRDPKAMDALIYKAMAMIQIAKLDKAPPERWTEIRRVIAAANQLDRDHPEPLILYYASFEEADQKPTDLASLGLQRAFELAPFDSGLRFKTASMLIDHGRADTARSILAPLAYDPHDLRVAKRAQDMIAGIDAKPGASGAAPDAKGKSLDRRPQPPAALPSLWR
ncbi:MAG: hypothetical protein ABW182_10170 [Sphingomonas sp.]